MCFSAQVSALAYVVGNTGSLVLYRAGHRVEALFFSYVLQMQLVEFFLWALQPCPNKYNTFVSKVGSIVNSLEPIFLWGSIVKFSHRKLPRLAHSLVGLFSVATLFYNKRLLSTECTTVTPQSYPHLHWKWNEYDYYNEYYALFVLTITVLCVYGLEYWRTCTLLNLSSYATAYYLYQDTHCVGSMWCFSVSASPWILLVTYAYLGSKLRVLY